MTDTVLRDRIAAALADITVSTDEWDELTYPSQQMLADAVIAALNLRQERQHGPFSHMYRYTTSWSSDYE